MPLTLTCPNAECGRTLRVADALQGKKVRCPQCGQVLGDTAVATFDLPTVPSETLPLPVKEPSGGTLIDARPLAGRATSVERIGRFEIRDRLGEGAFGEVFRAYDPLLDREVALKVAKPGALTTPDRVERFLREAKSAANLRHPNIVPLFESGRDGERYFIASAFIKGQTLEALLEQGRLPRRDAVAIIRKLSEALAYAHSQGIVHRDVKPANVLIDEHGDPMLTDFGLAARRLGEEKMTQDNAVMGTPAYMSPEQAAGKSNEAGPASDQYSLGIMLYEMLTEKLPFEGSMEVVIFNHLQIEPKRLRSVDRTVPKDLETICLKCLEKTPGKRYLGCEALAEDLRRWLAGEVVVARPLTWAERGMKWTKRNPAVAGLLAAVVIVSIVGGSVSYVNYLQAQTEAAKAKRQEAIALKQQLLAEEAARQAKLEEQKTKKENIRAEGMLYANNLALAQAAWNENNAAVANDYLDKCRWDYRGWEHDYLYTLIAQPKSTLKGHTSYVHSVTFSPDGKRLASASADMTVKVWDAATGQESLTLKGHTDPVWSVTFSPDGKRLASASNDQTVKVWDGSEKQIPPASGGMKPRP